jgi:3-methyladenine DNA glycosylase AlkD
MKYYVLNPEMDEKIKQIKTKIRLSMDGVVADKLTSMGMTYKNNYGVSLPRLQALAREFGANYDVAIRLWHMRERETMILAILTMPTEKVSESIAWQWMHELENIELTEQLSTHLIPKLNFAKDLCLKSIVSENTWAKVCGYQSLARIYSVLSEADVALIANEVEILLETENVYLQKAMARCMSRMSRKHSHWIESWASNILENKAASRTCALLYDEISQELKYF